MNAAPVLTPQPAATESPTLVVQPRRPWRILSGLLSGAAAIGVAHGVAGLVNPAASPLLAVGSTLIDFAPTPVKEFVVREVGTYDKPILVSLIGVVLIVVSAVIGLIAWQRPRTALVAIAGLGLVGLLTSVLRPGAEITDGLPSLAAIVVGVLALRLITRRYLKDHAPDQHGTADDVDHGAEITGAARGRARRGFLVGLGAAGAVAAVGTGSGITLGAFRKGGAGSFTGKLPAPVSAAEAIPAGAQIAGNTPFITSIPNFYRVDISLVTPRISAADWSLSVDGMVDSPFTLSYDELLAMPMIERDITLTCVSNEVGGPYVSTAKWLGVPFTEIIKRAGVQAGVDQVYSYSSDSGYTCSTPYQAVSDGRDAMIVVGMNGEVLPDKNGFPARMLVPGLFGFVSATKWLERIEFTTYAKRTAYWTERDWATDAPILTQSRIDVPKSLSTLPKAKPVLAGVAWAQHRGVEKVEIRVDGGQWAPAKLADEAGIDLWRQWTFVYDGPAGQHTAEVRATDKTGATQPEKRTKVFPDGARGWHQIIFISE
jgi:DMSO/TMAO reductase YedYZ molybdopterin-dependent catalytic subunit